jgi:hypothetical protein
MSMPFRDTFDVMGYAPQTAKYADCYLLTRLDVSA